MRINEFTDLATIAEVMEIQNTLKGMRIAISGHLGRNRQDVVKIIEMAGGVFHDSVKINTTHLLTNQDWTAGSTVGKVSTKFEKARRLGIKMITEKDFYDQICGSE